MISSISFILECIIYYLSFYAYITCIIHDFDILGIAQKISVISSLQDDKLFIIDLRNWVIHLRLWCITF